MEDLFQEELKWKFWDFVHFWIDSFTQQLVTQWQDGFEITGKF